MKFHIQVHGCQMNAAEGGRMAAALAAAGHVNVDSADEADVIIVHTCCVRQTAEEKILGKLGELKRWKGQRAGRVLGVTGCMAQLRGEALTKRCPHIDFVLGTAQLGRLAEAINARGRVVSVDMNDPALPCPVTPSPSISTFVPIMTGCDNFCTYCIVPYVRGRERSRPAADILAELRNAAARGCREVTLLGQNVNSYTPAVPSAGACGSFAELLRAVDGIEGIERVRFMTSHPKDLTADIIEAISGGRHLCEHIHLPAQHGGDRILKAMNRQYTAERYRALVSEIRAKIPGVAVTTDLIVGFPGESEEDFAATLELVRELRFDAAYTFLYSPRAGTPAAGLPNQISDAVKHERLRRLMDAQSAISLGLNRRLEGGTVEVLVEGPSRTDAGVWTGRTRSGKIVLWPHGGERAGELHRVAVTQAQTWTLKGRINSSN